MNRNQFLVVWFGGVITGSTNDKIFDLTSGAWWGLFIVLAFTMVTIGVTQALVKRFA